MYTKKYSLTFFLILSQGSGIDCILRHCVVTGTECVETFYWWNILICSSILTRNELQQSQACNVYSSSAELNSCCCTKLHENTQWELHWQLNQHYKLIISKHDVIIMTWYITWSQVLTYLTRGPFSNVIDITFHACVVAPTEAKHRWLRPHVSLETFNISVLTLLLRDHPATSYKIR